MVTIQNLCVTSITPANDGIFASARPADWIHEYSFFVKSDGTVKGRASSGVWLESSSELSGFIRAQVKSFLKEHATFIHTTATI